MTTPTAARRLATASFEPMLTKTFLESRPNVTVEFPTPSRYGKAGWYPSRYAVKKPAGHTSRKTLSSTWMIFNPAASRSFTSSRIANAI